MNKEEWEYETKKYHLLLLGTLWLIAIVCYNISKCINSTAIITVMIGALFLVLDNNLGLAIRRITRRNK